MPLLLGKGKSGGGSSGENKRFKRAVLIWPSQTFTLLMTLLCVHTDAWPLQSFGLQAVWCCILHTHTLTLLPPAECHFWVPLLFMSQPFYSVHPQPVVWLAALSGTICSPSQSNTHTCTLPHTHACPLYTHRPAACFVVPARGRLLHLSLSNLNPLAQQQLAPISSPMGLDFIKDTVMYAAACSRLISSTQPTGYSPKQGNVIKWPEDGLLCVRNKLLFLKKSLNP